MMFYSIFGLMNVLILLGGLAVSIYYLILFVKLATRGIRALDIYIEKNSRGDM